MRILIAHSFYRVPGGEDQYVLQEESLLREAGHQIQVFSKSNAAMSYGMKTFRQMLTGADVEPELADVFREFKPQIVHLHNIYPSLGPSVHRIAVDHGVPVVQTVHNFRLRCPNGYMYTEGQLCRRCEGGNHLHAVIHKCFPDRRQAVAYAAATWWHRAIADIEGIPVAFIAPSLFMKQRLEEWELKKRIVLVRNFSEDFSASEITRLTPEARIGAYIGRISSEKGIEKLIRSLQAAGDPPFLMIGDGPISAQMKDLAETLRLRRLSFLGRLDRKGLKAALARCSFAVFPSDWEENAPLAALEAMSAGLALIVTARGGLPELVGNDRGRVIPAGEGSSLADAIKEFSCDQGVGNLGRNARTFWKSEFTSHAHLKQLENLFSETIGDLNSSPSI